jgi:hypothetical protein
MAGVLFLIVKQDGTRHMDIWFEIYDLENAGLTLNTLKFRGEGYLIIYCIHLIH